MNIGILGCGYVGQAAALPWKKSGYTLSATTRQISRIPDLETIVDQVYLIDSQSFNRFLATQDILLISVAPDSPSDYAVTYLDTAKRVAERTRKLPSLRQILYTSSLSVYGDHQGEWIDEKTPPVPTTVNAKILLEAEQVLLNCATADLKVCIFRLGEIYGPGREIEERIRRTIHTSFAGTGASYTNLIHLEDIVRALDFALQHQLDGIYNLCSDEHIPRQLFYDRICKKERLPPVQWDPARTSPHQGNRRASNAKLKNEGFTFSHAHF